MFQKKPLPQAAIDLFERLEDVRFVEWGCYVRMPDGSVDFIGDGPPRASNVGGVDFVEYKQQILDLVTQILPYLPNRRRHMRDRIERCQNVYAMAFALDELVDSVSGRLGRPRAQV
jgi:hypothetical protein